MKAARQYFEKFPAMPPAKRLSILEGAKGEELCVLMHYAEGREPSETRDQVMGLVLVVAGERYLAKQALKAAKKAKRIF